MGFHRFDGQQGGDDAAVDPATVDADTINSALEAHVFEMDAIPADLTGKQWPPSEPAGDDEDE